jgi:hypothetical protein
MEVLFGKGAASPTGIMGRVVVDRRFRNGQGQCANEGTAPEGTIFENIKYALILTQFLW